MRFRVIGFLFVLVAGSATASLAAPDGGTISGKVSYKGNLSKFKPVDMSKEPGVRSKMHSGHPLFPETVVGGPGNSLQNVVVYISGGPAETSTPPTRPALFDQKDCHYTTHVLALRAGQEISISNSDPFSHNIHPLPRSIGSGTAFNRQERHRFPIPTKMKNSSR